MQEEQQPEVGLGDEVWRCLSTIAGKVKTESAGFYNSFLGQFCKVLRLKIPVWDPF